jgi:hypothetical protein
VGVVNAPHLALASTPRIEPYVRLGEALGSFAAQIGRLAGSGAPASAASSSLRGTSVTVEIEGAEASTAGIGELLRAAVLKGILPRLEALDLDESDVNLISAPHIAEDAGLAVKASVSPSAPSGGFASSVRVSIAGPGGSGERVVSGAIIEGEPRIVGVDFWA